MVQHPFQRHSRLTCNFFWYFLNLQHSGEKRQCWVHKCSILWKTQVLLVLALGKIPHFEAINGYELHNPWPESWLPSIVLGICLGPWAEKIKHIKKITGPMEEIQERLVSRRDVWHVGCSGFLVVLKNIRKNGNKYNIIISKFLAETTFFPAFSWFPLFYFVGFP